jgi:hypothetical protein
MGIVCESETDLTKLVCLHEGMDCDLEYGSAAWARKECEEGGVECMRLWSTGYHALVSSIARAFWDGCHTMQMHFIVLVTHVSPCSILCL